MAKTLKDLTTDNHIAFEDPTDGLVVSKVEKIYENGNVLVCYLYSGYKSTNQTLKPEEILAIGNSENGKTELPGWTGKYHVLQKEKLGSILKN